ncbi:MAG: phytanoyl-CoA dioxygenase family protein [Myxococcales bacterium]|nr:phytanoyl-CoA dioxygenase family protein [Myxococcales bacterium]
MSSSPRFNPETLPWLDRIYAEIDAYIDQQTTLPSSYDLREALIHWMRFGYVRLSQVISHADIDRYVDHVSTAMAHPERFRFAVNVQGHGYKPICEHERSALSDPHLRLCDFHNTSAVGKSLSLSRPIVEFLGHVFRSRVVAMQTLTFIHGTEQPLHQDHAYVVSEIPSHLAASWIALEDVRPEAGPLIFYPASHQVKQFNWGNGMFLNDESTRDELDFAAYLQDEVDRVDLEPKYELAKKGDVFLWHATLVHGGSAVKTPGTTRRSLVTHYSTLDAYTRDRRSPDVAPECFEINGGYVFANPLLPEEENALL